LSKNYNRLLVFGDSFVTPDFCVSPAESFWGLAANALTISEIINYAWAGSSLESIKHVLISEQDQYNWDTDLFLIGIPPLERLTFNIESGSTVESCGHKYQTSTWKGQQFKINSHYGLIQDLDLCARVLAYYESRAWLEVQAMQEIFLITTWLDSVNANYVIINLSHDFDLSTTWSSAKWLVNYCKNHNRCMLREDTYQSINCGINEPADYNLFGWSGHHGSNGNKYFFEKSLWPRMLKCNLV
jgi:hypothetical protein